MAQFLTVTRLAAFGLVSVAAIVFSSSAEARYGRRAAFVGGVAASAVAGAAVRAARTNYYYGAPAYYAAPAYYGPGVRCY
jgi:hypothetical protein